MIIFLFLSILSAALVASFAWQNTAMVTIKIWGGEYQGSLALICVGMFALGFLAHFLFGIPNRLKRRWTLYQQAKRIKDLEDDINEREKRPVFDSSHPPSETALK